MVVIWKVRQEFIKNRCNLRYFNELELLKLRLEI